MSIILATPTRNQVNWLRAAAVARRRRLPRAQLSRAAWAVVDAIRHKRQERRALLEEERGGGAPEHISLGLDRLLEQWRREARLP